MRRLAWSVNDSGAVTACSPETRDGGVANTSAGEGVASTARPHYRAGELSAARSLMLISDVSVR